MAKEDEKKEDEKLTPVGDGIETSEKEEKKEPKEEETDERVGHGEDDTEEEESGDNGEEISEERRKLREQRRREKQRRQQRIASDRRERDFLLKRNEQLERQLSQVVLRQDRQEEVVADGRIGHLESQIREAEAIHAQAIEAKDGATATEALRVRDALRDSLGKLKGSREARAKEREEQSQSREREETPRVHPEAARHGREWVERNSEWFDPHLSDEDSVLVRALEEHMAREGKFNPATPEYWRELDRRIDARLPNLRSKAKNGKEDDDGVDWGDDDSVRPKKAPTRKPGGPRIAVGGKTRSLKPNEVYISEQRKQALMEAGVWDDEVKRERYLQSYKRYDDEAAARNS